jgi:hypothetical protein
MSKNEPFSKTQVTLTTPTTATIQSFPANPDAALIKLGASPFLNKSNDCLVIDMGDDVENQPTTQTTADSLGKKPAKTKVLFDLNNDVNKLSTNTINNNNKKKNKNKAKKSDSLVAKGADEKKKGSSTLGINLRRFSSNFSSRLTNGAIAGGSSGGGKSVRYSKRMNSSSSNIASPQVIF